MTDIISATTTLLDAALACFERVQIARSFDQDFNSHRIKLDIIQLRLSRWGEAAGLYSSSSDSTALSKADGQSGATNEQTPLRIADHDAARDLLQAIADQFALAQEQAASIAPPQKDGMIDPANDLSSPTRTLRTKLRAALGRRRAALVKATHSVQWAFYKKQQFDDFVADISESIDQLEALFAAVGENGEADQADETKKRLCELGAAECVGINKVYLKVLGAVTKECDPYLDAAVAEALKPREAAAQGGNTTINMTNKGGNYGQQIGQMSGTQKGFSFGTTNHFGKGTTNNWGAGAN
ncbi:Heterokaryon incompatibility protein S [Lasiodiplodia hormozganensis]|uniref:Heterokaryon incompatibility protein S n=1 Tax=Lasiodiplodia hormozganensis TaxID=869390 RepID=A0AA39WA09_9PEZI|nr:Heterokaryon incompatibility protein S [Lasiodiplodia hormozganensis]